MRLKSACSALKDPGAGSGFRVFLTHGEWILDLGWPNAGGH